MSSPPKFQRTLTQGSILIDEIDLSPRSKRLKEAQDILKKPPHNRTDEDINCLAMELTKCIEALKKTLNNISDKIIKEVLLNFQSRLVKKGQKIIVVDEIGEEMYSIIQGSIEVLVRGAPPWVPERIPFESEEQVKDYMAEDDAISMKYEATDQVIPGYTNEETQEVVVSKVIYEIYSLKSVFKASDGFTFGVDALLTGNPRNATIRATEDCHLVTLTKDKYDLLLRKEAEKAIAEKIKFMKQFILFSLANKFLQSLHNSLKEDKIYNKGDIIYREFDHANMLFFIHHGEFAVEKTIYKQPKAHGNIELYAIIDPETMEKISITCEDPKAAKRQIVNYYKGKSAGPLANRSKTILNVSVIGENQMFGIEDAITGIRKRIFTMRCVSDTAQVSYITKIEYQNNFYRKLKEEADTISKQRLKFLLVRIQESLSSKADMIEYMGRKQLMEVEKKYERPGEGSRIERHSVTIVKNASPRPLALEGSRGPQGSQGSVTNRYISPKTHIPMNSNGSLECKPWDITQSVRTTMFPPSLRDKNEELTTNTQTSQISNSKQETAHQQVLRMRLQPLTRDIQIIACQLPKTASGTMGPRILVEGRKREEVRTAHPQGQITTTTTRTNESEGILSRRVPTSSEQFRLYAINTPNPFVKKYKRILETMKREDDFYITEMQEDIKHKLESSESEGNMKIAPLLVEKGKECVRASKELDEVLEKGMKYNIKLDNPRESMSGLPRSMPMAMRGRTMDIVNIGNMGNIGNKGSTSLLENQVRPERLLEYYGSLTEGVQPLPLALPLNQEKSTPQELEHTGRLQHLRQYNLRRSGSGYILKESTRIMGAKANSKAKKGRRGKGGILLRSTKHNMFRTITYPTFSSQGNHLI